MEKRRLTKALASQKRFHCLHQVRISDGRHFKHIKWRNDWDRLHKLAFRKWSSLSSFQLLFSSPRRNVVYIRIVIHIFTNDLLRTIYHTYRTYVIRVIRSRNLERNIIILQTMVTFLRLIYIRGLVYGLLHIDMN